MKRIPPFVSVLLLLLVSISSCHTVYKGQSLHYDNYRVNDSTRNDTAMLALLDPYTTNINQVMWEKVGWASVTLVRHQPESTLGNFMTDAFLTMAREKFNSPVDIAVMNYGGIRLTELPAGAITNGKMYELMPFDNLLVVQQVTGTVLQQFLDLTAANGGWPVAGMTMEIRDKKAINVRIAGKPLDSAATYALLNSDFVANGGEKADMLRNIPQRNVGYLMRDALFDYIQKEKAAGRDVSATLENRVRYAD